MPDTVDDNTQVVVAVEGHHPIGMKVMVEIDLVGESRSKKGKIEMMLRTMTKYIPLHPHISFRTTERGKRMYRSSELLSKYLRRVDEKAVAEVPKKTASQATMRWTKVVD